MSKNTEKLVKEIMRGKNEAKQTLINVLKDKVRERIRKIPKEDDK